jgi:hypothetical protein
MDDRNDKKTLQIGKGKAGPGRPKGAVNKVTALLKDEILQAADQAHEGGRVGYLTQQAKDNPGPFMTLLGKILPTQVEGTGEAGEIIFRTIYEGK